jgi:hypothetical protein
MGLVLRAVVNRTILAYRYDRVHLVGSMNRRISLRDWLGRWICVSGPTVALLLALVSPARAQEPTAVRDVSDGSELSVSLITMGPGRHVWERYGHNALWIQDNRTGLGRAYNYGIFSFEQENFLVRFVQGRPEYWMQGFDVETHLQDYVAQNRSVWIQKLNLTPVQRAALRDFLEWNERPENRYYRYDPYRDNCSSRIRDAIDRVLEGRLREVTDGEETGATFRSHSLRLVTEALPTYVGLLTALGQPSDQPLSQWEEMFIPLEMRRHLRDVRVLDADGREVPLVLSERTLFESSATYGRETPPNWTLAFLAVGLVLAAVIAVPVLRARRPVGRVAATVPGSLWALLAGLFGLVLAGLWVFTNHWIAYGNENLFLLSPVALPLVVALPFAARGDRWARRTSVVCAGLMAGLSVLGFLVQVLPWFSQVNGSIIALTLPPNLAVGWLALRLRNHHWTAE